MDRSNLDAVEDLRFLLVKLLLASSLGAPDVETVIQQATKLSNFILSGRLSRT